MKRGYTKLMSAGLRLFSEYFPAKRFLLVKSLQVVSIIFLFTQLCNGEQFVLVKDGKSKCAIVLPKGYSPSMEHGAKDLGEHLKLMSGADVTVYKQTDNKDIPSSWEGLILITDKPAAGEKPVGKEAFRITTIPGKPWIIRIYGDKKRGAMYGCYGLLQDVLGCRWYTKSISKIPKNKTIAVGPLKIHEKPAFEYREPYYTEVISNNKSWLVRNRVNGNTCSWAGKGDLDASVGGKIKYANPKTHTMLWLVPPKKYFKEHPEYFSLINGRRIHKRGSQLCLSNPDVLKICIKRVKQWIKEQPQANIFSVSQMDSLDGACECANCQKIVKEEGAESGPILRFVNAVAKEVGKEYPNVVIDTYAYAYSQVPPKHVKPLSNVRIRFCLTDSCKAHALDSKCSRSEFKYLQDWGKITDKLYIFDYDTNFYNFPMLHPSMNYLKTVFKLCHDNGAIGYFMLGGCAGRGSSFADIKAYLCARLMWDPEQDTDKLMDEYFEDVYGKSAPIVKELINLFISPFEKNPKIKLGNYDRYYQATPYLNSILLNKADELLAKAYVVSADNPVALEELRKIQMWVDYSRITQMNIIGDVKDGKYIYNVTPKDLDCIERAFKSLKHYKVASVGAGRKPDINKTLTRKHSKLDCLTLDNNRLRVDILPEVGGKIVRLLNKQKGGEELLFQSPSAFDCFTGGIEGAYVKSSGDIEKRNSNCWKTKFKSVVSGNTATLTGMSPNGGEITRQYILNANKLIIKTTAKNTTNRPLTVKFWDDARFKISKFSDINASFKTVAGYTRKLTPGDFLKNWLKLHKYYGGKNIPERDVVLKLRNTRIIIQPDNKNLLSFHMYNDGRPSRLRLTFVYKEITLKPGESASVEESMVIN